MDAGRISPEDAERILRVQKEQNLRFGDAALSLGLLSQSDIQFALSRQFDYPYLRAGDTHVAQEVVAAFQPFSPQVEQLRALRSHLMLRWINNDIDNRTLAIVSASAGDGRRWLAANLAVVFSQLGERTLLVDADLRQPRQHTMFNLENHAGLSTLLAGREGANSLIKVEALQDLTVLPAGPVPPNPQELLNRPRLQELMQQWRRDYDVILLDTPSSQSVADAQTIGAMAGACLVVARKNYTRVADLARLKEQHAGNGTQVLGVLLNEY
jgi:chain length determinant protein tyrosine kinase EpsG